MYISGNFVDTYCIVEVLALIFFAQASNPGQFDSDVDVLWAKGRQPDAVVHIVSTGY